MFRYMAAMGLFYDRITHCWDKDQVKVLDHPCKDLLLSSIRNKDSSHETFVSYTSRLMRLLLEYTLGFEPKVCSTKYTSLGVPYDHYELEHGKNYCMVVILRAGNCMMNEIQQVMPGIASGFVLVQRDEESREKNPIYYYSKFPPDIAERRIILVDPMLGTGGSALTAIKAILDKGGKEENIVFINLFAYGPGFDRVLSVYPKVKFITAVIDPILNEQKYLVPGVGDFGDRYYNTV